jgi:DNA-binding MarR family transcriptional regulator/GNAT superfamily N-acetyltransferase
MRLSAMPEPGTAVPADCVAAVRRFNRFYTQQIGVLHEGLAHSPFSLTETRVLYELARRDKPTAAELCADLELDAGYLSRILAGYKRRGLIERERSGSDGRESLLTLTRQGHQTLAPLEERTRADIGAMLGRLASADQMRLLDAMTTIERLLEAKAEPTATFLLRPHQPGDMGWVVKRHGELYAQEYGYDEQFEALVASIVAQFIQHYDPKGERCWMAEREGENVGCVFLVRQSRYVAKLRLLLVDPKARGFGIGSRLVNECVAFARRAGYRTMTLWTQSDLHAARRIYRHAGFTVVEKKPHHSFGHDLVAETWQLKL